MRLLVGTGNVYYAMPTGEVITDAEWRQRPSWRQTGARHLPRWVRRRLVDVRAWRNGARAPREIRFHAGGGR